MQNFSESAWSRGWSDTKKGLGNWLFWGLEVFGGGLMAIFISPAAALIFILGIAVALWLVATARAPIRQRNELRQMAPKTTRPQLSIEGAISEMDANNTVVFSLKLKNAGPENLQKCKVVCKNIRNDRGEIVSQEDITFGQDYQYFNDEYGVFSLMAGEEKEIEIARIPRPYERNKFRIKGKGKGTERSTLPSSGDYELEIYVYGSPRPVPAVLRLYINENLGPKIDLIDGG